LASTIKESARELHLLQRTVPIFNVGGIGLPIDFGSPHLQETEQVKRGYVIAVSEVSIIQVPML